MSLPDPDDLTSFVLRTDFSDDQAWQDLQDAINAESEYPSATYVNDPVYADADVPALIALDGPGGQERIWYLFVADAVSMRDPEHLLLAVDLADEPGRTFRVPPRHFLSVSANLCIANMDFADFANAVDDSGVYRESGHEEDRRLMNEKPWLRSGRTIHVLEGAQIQSLDDFWRCWLKIAGDNGRYFGRSLAAFDDALSGGPGWPEGAVGADFIVEWRDHEISQAGLGRSFGHLVKVFERRVPGCLKLC